MRPSLILLLALVLGACDPGSLVGQDVTTPTPSAPSALEVGDCDDDVRAELGRTIDAQLEAFASEDWDGALDLATDDFRSGFDAERFEAVIEQEFPVVAGYAEREFGPCLVGDDLQARIVVVVTDDRDDSQALTYLMLREADVWRIGGAVPLDGGDDEDDGPLI